MYYMSRLCAARPITVIVALYVCYYVPHPRIYSYLSNQKNGWVNVLNLIIDP